LFSETAAAKGDYKMFDLTSHTPLVTSKHQDESGRKWDREDASGLRYEKSVVDVEYHRQIKPILARSCVACHSKSAEKPAGGLVLDDDSLVEGPKWDLGNAGKVPATYNTLAGNYIAVTKYVRGFQSRRSPLVWKLYGKRLDGLPAEPPKNRADEHKRILAQGDFKGSIMPPPEAVKDGKVAALSDEDRRTIIRWIDLGCPVDKSFEPEHADERGSGWMLDDHRPTLAVTYPAAGKNAEVSRVMIGLHDYSTGLDLESLRVVADVEIDGVAAGDNLAAKFKEQSPNVWQWKLSKPLTKLASAKLTVEVRDREGNTSRVERTFSAGP
jgi:hypothetical protein